MRTGQTVIRPLMLTGKHCAFELMIMLYQSFNDENLKFWEDFWDYTINGYVRISPTAMAFAKPCRDKEGEYWFIRAAVGPLAELLAMLPVFLPRIAWCRNNDGVIRMYKTERLIAIAVRNEVKKASVN